MITFRETDRYFLIALFDYRRQFLAGQKYVEFARPMDIGGRGRSDHAAGLTLLARLGLVERRQRRDGQSTLTRSRASYEYRIADAGILQLGGAQESAASVPSRPAEPVSS
jgi:hypothetical protein